MAIDDNASYELTGYQVKDLASKVRAKVDSAALASVATSGLYSDLTGAPTIPTVYNGKLTITMNGTNVGEFTANQSTDTTIALTGGPSYTAGNGIDIANDEISIDGSVVATQTDLDDYVTLGTDQNITGEKTFVGNKRIKFKGTANNSRLGFTAYDQNNGEIGFLEAEGLSTASKKVRLGCYDGGSSGSAHDNYLGFQYHNTNPVGGGTVSYNMVCPPHYKGVSGFNSYAYVPLDFTDGTTTVRAGTDGILDISTLLPSYSDFVGATSLSDGSEGLVPAPAAGDDTKFLSGDGSWKSAGGEAITIYSATNQAVTTPTATYGAGVVVPLTAASTTFDSNLFELYNGGVRVKKAGTYLVQANFMIGRHQTNGVYAIPQTYKNANVSIANCYERSYSTTDIWYGGSLAARAVDASANDVFYLRAASSQASYSYRFAGQSSTFLTVQKIS